MTLDFESDLDVFFNDDEMATQCTLPGAVVVNVLFDLPSQESFNGSIVSSNPKMTGKTTEVGALASGQEVTINSAVYVVKKVMRKDDGLLCEVELGKKLS